MRLSGRVFTVLLATALTASCGKKPVAAAGGPGGPGQTPMVAVSPPLVKRVVDWDDYEGRFEALDTVSVRARVAGFIQTVNFKDGQIVRRGQLLFTIDPRPYQAASDQARALAAQARATLALAQADFARVQELIVTHAISQEDFDTRRGAVAQDQAALASAEANARAAALNLSFTRVVAPLAGRASDRRVDPGNSVNGGPTGGDLLTTIVSLDPIHFTFEGSEPLYLKYQRLNREGKRTSSRYASNPVDIRLQDETTYRWRGRMVFVDNALDTSSGAIRGKALVRNPEGYLTPGLFGHMRLLSSGAYDALVVPDSAVVSDQARKLIYVVARNGTVEGRPVQLGPLFDGLRIVRDGVGRNDQVIVEGGQQAHPGVKVKTRPGKIVAPAPGESPQPSELTPLQPASSATSAGSG